MTVTVQMSKSFTFFTDPAHGWLAVTLDDVHAVGLKVTDFSPYSYINHEKLYLEEDCDAGVFMEAYKRTHGAHPVLTERHSSGDSLIRQQRRIGQ